MAILAKPAATVHRARKLRPAMTPPEARLWSELRLRPSDLKFRRQHPAGRYVLDFYCAAARLAIEVDGEIHNRSDAPSRDAALDAELLAAGVLTLRIPAVEITRDLDAVVTAATSRQPLHHRTAPGGPPPQDKPGEDD